MSQTNPDPSSGEPAVTVGAVAAAVGAVLTLLIAFGVNLSEAQTEAILGVVLVAGPLVLAAITRGRVWSPATVAKLLRR